MAIGEQSRTILRRHPWLAGLVITRPVLGPNGVALLEHVLTVLAPHPADIATKLEAFAMLNPKFPPSRLVDAFDQVVEPLITEITCLRSHALRLFHLVSAYIGSPLGGTTA